MTEETKSEHKTYTFCGHWNGNRIAIDYVLEGEHQDLRQGNGPGGQGLWAASASGATEEEAMAAAIAEYEDDEDDEEIQPEPARAEFTTWGHTREAGTHIAQPGAAIGRLSVETTQSAIVICSNGTTTVIEGTEAEVLAWARELYVQALRATHGASLASLVEDLTARTYPANAQQGDRSDRHVVDVHKLTVDVQVMDHYTEVWLGTDEFPDEHKPIGVWLGGKLLTEEEVVFANGTATHTECDECHALIPNANVSEVSPDHDEGCSLHPETA